MTNNLKANRELDAAVAERVMGEEWTHISPDRVWDDIPAYSTDISAAWQVVLKLVEMGYYVDIGVDEHGAQVQLDKFGGRDINWILGESIRGKDAPEAICRAAPKAVDRETG